MQREFSLSSPSGVLAVLSCRGVGPSLARNLIESHSQIEEIVDASSLRNQVPRNVIANWPTKNEWKKNIEAAIDLIERSANSGIRSISYWDNEYPKLLRLIPDPPLVLYARGSLAVGNRVVACVGTREPSPFGEIVSDRVSRALASKGWSITSGLALGIDSISHAAALDEGGHTTAVLAGPLDSIYPKRNKYLADKILDHGGALVSEQVIGSPVGKGNFVKRDRIQSGLSVATFIFQTGIRGGAMHTAKYTLLQDRFLVVPMPIGEHQKEEKSEGITALATMTGLRLATCLQADRTLEEIIRRKFWDQPAAYSLKGNSEYDLLFGALEEKLSSIFGPNERNMVQPYLFD